VVSSIYMKTTTLAITAIITAMVLMTASTLASPALAISGSSTSKKKKDSSDTNTSSGGLSTSSSTKATKSTSSTSGGTSSSTSSVSKQLKSLITCLTAASTLTGTMPNNAEFATCESQSSFGTVGGPTTGGTQVSTTRSAQVTPVGNPMCDPTDKNINASESRVCGVPKTPSAATTSTSTTTEQPSTISPS
jgi:hypothetical protein